MSPMSSATLAAGGVLLFAVAAVLGHVGRRIASRQLSAEARAALRSFAGWWYAFAGIHALTAALSIAVALGYGGSLVAAAFAYGSVPLYVLGFLGILHYLIYLGTGWRNAGKVLMVTMGAYAAVLFAAMYRARPTGTTSWRWQAGVEFAGPEEAVNLLLLPLALAPVVLAAAYARLYFKTSARDQRYRVGLVAGALFVLFAFGFLTTAAGLSTNDLVQLSARGVSLLAALAVAFAYDPPAFVRHRFGIHPFETEVEAPVVMSSPENLADARRRAQSLAGRVRDLV